MNSSSVTDQKKVLMVVDRYPSQKDWTLSEFFIDSIRRGVGVEDEYREIKVNGETRVDAGIYPLGFRYSPKFSKSYYRDDLGYLNPIKTKRFYKEHELIWIMYTPRHEYVLIHWGNTDDDTDACYIVGSNFASFDGQRGVGGSRVKYTEIYPVLFQAMQKMQKEGITPLIEFKDKSTPVLT
jgi:hypothetical protein